MAGKQVALRPAAVIVPQGAPVLPYPQPPQRAGESAATRTARWSKRNNHFTTPVALLPAMWVLGLILHHAHLVALAGGCGGVLAACVWIFAPNKWTKADGEPQWREVWYARLSAVFGAGWLTMAAWLGPLSGFIPAVVLVSVLAAGCTAWGIPWFMHKRPRGMKRTQRLVAECNAWWMSHAHAWNLAGSHVTEAHLSGVTLRIRVRGLPGRHTYQHFQQAVSLIESAAEGMADIGLVRIGKVKGKPSEVDIFLKRENPLRGDVVYDMGMAPQSVHEPASFGVAESGEQAMRSLRRNRFAIGEIRSGKSNDLLVGIAHLSGCPDGRYVLIDLKGGRSARPVLKSSSAEYVITGIDEARMYSRMAVADIKARATNAYDGNEQLLATEAIPGMWTMVDETYGLTATENGAGDAECRRNFATVASQGAGLEYYLWIFTQNGSLETSVGTEQIRGNLPWRTCYRVAEARHGQYVIPEYSKLDASKLEENGTCYDKYGKDVTPEQIRRPLMDHAQLTRIASQNAALLGARPPLVLYCGAEVAYKTADGTEVTWQEWWDGRWHRLPAAFRADSPQYQAAAAADPVTAADVIAQARHAVPPAPSPEPGTGSGRTAAAQLAGDDAELMSRVPADFKPDPALVKRLPRMVATQKDRFRDAIEAATQDSPVTPQGLMEGCGMGRSWVFGRLADLAEIGVVTQVSRGRYAMVPGMDVRRGLAEITARGERLAREAQQMVDAQ